jgi:hypothetical protein
MSYFSSIASTINYFNNLINNQISQNQFNSFLNQTTQNQTSNSSSTTATQDPPIPEALGNALTSLAGILNTNANTSVTDVSNIAYTVDKLVSAGASNTSIQSLLDALAGDTGDIAYTRTGSNDPNITLQNRVQAFGGDLQNFLSQATYIAQMGGNINKYIDTAANVVAKGDYDDLRRFISVTGTVMYRGQDLQKFYDFTNNILDVRHYDMESNIFSLQTMMNQGASLDTALKIMGNMENTGLAGRNNMVDLNRVTIDARNKGLFLPYLLQQMGASGDTRAFMDAYMAANGMQSTAPDFSLYNVIERIDGAPLTITHGDSAALFAQAISSVDGLLPQSVLYWSSMQTGAMSHGSSYLDLSKLGPGTYDIYVKIGNYAGGTDTAKKTVIVLPNADDETKGNNGLGDTKDDDNDDKFDDASNPGHNNTSGPTGTTGSITASSTTTTTTQSTSGKDKENNGLGDTKDDDNTIKFDDASNPGHNKTVSVQPTIVQPITNPPDDDEDDEDDKVKSNNGLGDTKDDDNTVKFVDTSNPGHNKTDAVGAPVTPPPVQPVNNTSPVNVTPVVAPVYFPPVVNLAPPPPPPNIFHSRRTNHAPELSDLAKLESLVGECKDLIKEASNFLNEHFGKDKVCDFLNNNGQTSLAQKYDKGDVKWFDMLLAMGRDVDFYSKACEELRSQVNRDEFRKSCHHRGICQESIDKSLTLLGYDKQKTSEEEDESTSTTTVSSEVLAAQEAALDAAAKAAADAKAIADEKALEEANAAIAAQIAAAALAAKRAKEEDDAQADLEAEDAKKAKALKDAEDARIKSNNGLGDTKDDDNTVKFDDASNPGHNNITDINTEIQKENNSSSDNAEKK